MASSTKSRITRRGVAHDAGLSGLSLMSVVAGVVTAYGTFAIVAAVVGAVLSGSGVETDFRTNDWTGNGAVAALASAVTLLVAYLFGGYVAGRMARRNATIHGLAVFLLSLIAGALAGAVVGLVGDNDELKSNLQSIGVPTSTEQVKGVALVGAVTSLVAILVGSVLGAMWGERWHTKVARRASDPEYGPEAEARREAEHEERDRRDRVHHDEALRRDREERAETEKRQDDREPRRADPAPGQPGQDEENYGAAPVREQHDASKNEQPRYTAEEWRQAQNGPEQ